MRNSFKSTLIFFLTAAIWGFAFVAQRVGGEHIGAFSFNGIRFALGAVSLIPIVLIFEKEKKDTNRLKKTLLVGILGGLFLFAATALQQFGIVFTESAGKSGFITGLYTIIVPIISFIFGKRTGVFVWIGALLSLVGLYFICMNGSSVSFSLGDILLLLCSLLFALHIIVIDRFVSDVSPLKFAMFQFAAAAIFNIICMLFFEAPTFLGIKQAAIPLLYGGIMSTGVAYTCQIIGQKNADPTYSAIILSTESVFAAIGGALILNETMPPIAYLGCALIFIGIVLAQIPSKKAK